MDNVYFTSSYWWKSIHHKKNCSKGLCVCEGGRIAQLCPAMRYLYKNWMNIVFLIRISFINFVEILCYKSLDLTIIKNMDKNSLPSKWIDVSYIIAVSYWKYYYCMHVFIYFFFVIPQNKTQNRAISKILDKMEQECNILSYFQQKLIDLNLISRLTNL